MTFDEEEISNDELEEENECYYGFEECLDRRKRDMESCIGCQLLILNRKG